MNAAEQKQNETDSGRRDDAEAVGRVLAADVAALRRVYMREATRLLSVAVRILGSRSEAEDVVQETFLRFWQRAAQFDPSRGSLAGWLLSMTRNRAIDRLRSLSASQRAKDASGREGREPVGATPHDSAERAQLRERLRKALAELPQEQRKTIELAYLEGLSQSEIAARLGDPLGTVKTRMRTAMMRLAELVPEFRLRGRW